MFSEYWECPICKVVERDHLYDAREHFIQRGLEYTPMCDECGEDMKPHQKEH